MYELQSSNISPYDFIKGNYFTIKNKIWRGTSVSIRCIPKRFPDRVPQNSQSFNIAVQH
ncbi:unnamed protein product, partial [Hymenolepis diminuta]